MGNIGRPSTGCQRCRARRVKCDEGRPGCARCSKLSEPCPGYANDAWVFRHENDAIRVRLSRTSRSRQTARANLDSNTDTDQDETKKKPLARELVNKSDDDDDDDTTSKWIAYKGPSPAHTPETPASTLSLRRPKQSVDVEYQSVCLFMEAFTLEPGPYHRDGGHLHFLPGLYRAAKPDTCLRQAVDAVSLMTLVSRHHAVGMIAPALESYSRALKSTNKALQDPVLVLEDSTLAAIWLLGLYELISVEIQSHTVRGWVHHMTGASHLLTMRGRRGMAGPTGRELFHLSYLSILIKAMMLHEEPPASFTPDKLVTVSPDHIWGPELATAWRFFGTAVQIRAKIKTLQDAGADGSSEHEFREKMLSLTESGHDCLERYNLGVATTGMLFWQPQTISGNNATEKHFFTSIWIMTQWVQYWTATMNLCRSLIDGHMAILESLDRSERDLGRDDGPQSTKGSTNANAAIKSLETMAKVHADRIVGCMGFALGKIDSEGRSISDWKMKTQAYPKSVVGALYLFWPAGVIIWSPYTTREHKELASSFLKQIGLDFGLAQALKHSHLAPEYR